MAEFEVGQNVRVRCSAHPGPFPGETFVIIESAQQKISGFVRETDVKEGHIEGKIVSIGPNKIIVKFPGSFFTGAAGRTSFPKVWAHNNLRLATA